MGKKKAKNKKRGIEVAATRAVSDTLPRRFAGGRASVDTADDVYSSALSIMTPVTSDEYWRDYNLDSKTLNRTSVSHLMELLVDVSPDVSNGLWQLLRFCNPGFEVKVYKAGSKKVAYRAGQKALDEFLSNLHGPYVMTNVVPVDVVIGVFYLSAALRGAFCSELVLDERGRMPLELAAPDPATVKFKKVFAEGRGYAWQPGQWQRGQFVGLDRVTFSYIPIDPLPGKPNGRPIFAPALFSCVFLIGLMHDLRRVIAQQGYPRLDITIDLPALLEMMPKNLSADAAATKKWVDAAVAEVQSYYSTLEPDDAYIHNSAITVNRPVGTLDSSSLSASKGIIEALERFTIRAIKSQPILMGAQSVDQASSNRQWEIHAAGIKSIQHYCEFMLERQCQLALRVQGIQADVEWRFSELRAAELLRDEQYRRLNNLNTAYERDQGWIDQKEAAQKTVKHEPVADGPIAKADDGLQGVPTGEAATEPGSERSVPLQSQPFDVLDSDSIQ